jgi:hypothetical protein
MTTQPHIEALQQADTPFFNALLDRDIPALETLLAAGYERHAEAGTLQGRMAPE